MNKYRIIEETGELTGDVSFLIQTRRRKLFGGYKWVYKYQYHPECHRRLLEFNTLKEAIRWINYETEDVSSKIHECGE